MGSQRVGQDLSDWTHTQLSSVQLLSGVWLFATSWTAACQASLFIINSRSLLKLMSIKPLMPTNHFILCHPLLFSPSTFPSIRVFSNESALHIRWPKYWSWSPWRPILWLESWNFDPTEPQGIWDGLEIEFKHEANGLLSQSCLSNYTPKQTLDNKAYWSFLVGEHLHGLGEECIQIPGKSGIRALYFTPPPDLDKIHSLFGGYNLYNKNVIIRTEF